MSQLSYAQSLALKVVSNLAISLSIVGSSLIVTSIFRQQKQLKHLKESTLHQLLLGLSICDITCALVTLGAGLFIPRESRPWAVGNQYSCSAGGFLYIFFATGGNFYNMFLSIYFWRRITTNKKRAVSSQSSKQKDWWFRLGAHSTSICVSFLFSLAGIITNSYHMHDFVGFCYYTEYPHGCDKDSHVECEGGIQAELIGRLRIGVISFNALTSIVVTVLLAIHVWRNIDRSRKYSLRRQIRRSSTQSIQQLQSSEFNATSISSKNETQDGPNVHNTSGSSLSTQALSSDRPNNCKQREVASQAIWYLLAYVNSFVFLLAANIVTQFTDNRGSPGPYIMLLLLSFFQPLQGALNFIVFIRPRYKAWRIHLEKQQERDPDNHSTPPFPLILKKAIMEQVPSYRQPGRRMPQADQGQGSSNLSQVQPVSCASVLSIIPEDADKVNGKRKAEKIESDLSVDDASFPDVDESLVFGIDKDEESDASDI